jgi:hypothetical protein
MTKSSHVGTGDLPQNQNNSMSDDPGDGNRNSFTAKEVKAKGVPGAPDDQGPNRLAELGKQGASQE